MAEDEETPQEETEAVPEEQAKGPGRRRRRTVDKPVSLYPLSFEDAVDGLLRVKPEPDEKTKKVPTG